MAPIENLNRFFLETHNGSFIISHSPTNRTYNHSNLKVERAPHGIIIGSHSGDLTTLIAHHSPDKYLLYTTGQKKYLAAGSAVVVGYHLLITNPGDVSEIASDTYTNLMVGILMDNPNDSNLVYTAAEVKTHEGDGIVFFTPTIAFDPYFGHLELLLKQGLITEEQVQSILEESITRLDNHNRGSARWTELEIYKNKSISTTIIKELTLEKRKSLWINFLNLHGSLKPDNLRDLPETFQRIILKILYPKL